MSNDTPSVVVVGETEGPVEPNATIVALSDDTDDSTSTALHWTGEARIVPNSPSQRATTPHKLRAAGLYGIVTYGDGRVVRVSYPAGRGIGKAAYAWLLTFARGEAKTAKEAAANLASILRSGSLILPAIAQTREPKVKSIDLTDAFAAAFDDFEDEAEDVAQSEG